MVQGVWTTVDKENSGYQIYDYQGRGVGAILLFNKSSSQSSLYNTMVNKILSVSLVLDF